MPIHKVIIGEGGEKYLPFALSRLRHLKIIGASTTAQKYTFEDGAVTVRVEYNPIHGNHFVRIDSNPGAVGYEFLTTFDDVRNDPINWWSTAVVPAAKGLTGKLLSQAPTNGDPTPSALRDPYARAINRQRNTQHFWWPSDPDADIDAQVRTKPYFVTSTAGANTWQITALDWQNRLGSYVGDGASGVWIAPVDFGVDVTVDVPPTIYEDGKALSGAPVPLAPAWWRRAATLDVDGARYVVMSDSHGGFWCWPAEFMTDSGEKFLIPRGEVKHVRAHEYMPVGVVVPSVETMVPFERGIPTVVDRGLGPEWDIPAADEVYFDPLTGLDVEPGTIPKNQLQIHQYLWDFRGDGVRAAAVVHTNLNNNHLWLTKSGSPIRSLREYGPQYRIAPEYASSIDASAWVDAAGGLGDVKVTERAVLEVEFGITKTTDGFTFTVTVTRFIQGAWFFDAQYAYRDRRLEALGVEGDALLTDEIRVYRSGSRMPGQARADDQFIVTRNQDTVADVARFCVSRDRGFIAFDDWYFINPGSGTYPGLVSSLPVHRWNFQDIMPTGNYWNAIMVASDLRSMSKVLRVSADGAPQGLHAVVFGEVRQDKGIQGWTEDDTLSIGQARVAPAFVTPETGGSSDVSGAIELDTHRVIYSRVTAGYGFSTTVHNGISTHPDGHFAVFAHYYGAFDGIFDLIEYRRVTKREDGTLEESFDRTTHVAAFEKATKFTFDPEQYQANIPGFTPLVVQRFSGWRNVRMGKVKGGEFAELNPRFEETP